MRHAGRVTRAGAGVLAGRTRGVRGRGGGACVVRERRNRGRCQALKDWPYSRSGALAELGLDAAVLGLDVLRLLDAERLEAGGDLGVVGGEDGGGEIAGVACAADPDGGDGDAAGHLDGGEERVDAAERADDDGDGDDGEGGVGGDHAGEVGGAAGRGEDDAEVVVAGGAGEGDDALGGAVRGGDGDLVRDAEAVEDLPGLGELIEVAVRAHHDEDFASHGRDLLGCGGGVGWW